MTPNLISRLESAPEGNRELDALVWIAARSPDGFLPLAEGYHWEFEAEENGSINCYVHAPDGGSSRQKRFRPDPYTTSLDAAMSLVPDGLEKEMTDLYGVARVTVGLNSSDGGHHGSNACGSLPLALCSAALKARIPVPDKGMEP